MDLSLGIAIKVRRSPRVSAFADSDRQAAAGYLLSPSVEKPGLAGGYQPDPGDGHDDQPAEGKRGDVQQVAIHGNAEDEAGEQDQEGVTQHGG